MSGYEEIRMMLSELNWISILLRLLLATLFGGLIGIDRARKRRPAGLRTYMLVSLGAALVMITNQYIVAMFPASDPARLGAQVISGIGFLGAGTIIVTRHRQVIGLTTAAGLWASACMGLAVGIGFYEGAIITCLLIVFIVSFMQRLDDRVMARSKVMEVYIELSRSDKFSSVLSYLAERNIRVTNVETTKARDVEGKGYASLLTLRLPGRCDHTQILHDLSHIDEISFIEEV